MSQLRNKFLKLFLAAALILSVTGLASAQSLPGSGTSSNPYEISSCTDFYDVQNNPDSSYVLTNDIDCSGTLYDTPEFTFTGTLDGQNYVVSNRETSGNNYGFWDSTDNANINNLVLDNFSNENDNAVYPISFNINGGSYNNIVSKNHDFSNVVGYGIANSISDATFTNLRLINITQNPSRTESASISSEAGNTNFEGVLVDNFTGEGEDTFALSSTGSFDKVIVKNSEVRLGNGISASLGTGSYGAEITNGLFFNNELISTSSDSNRMGVIYDQVGDSNTENILVYNTPTLDYRDNDAGTNNADPLIGLTGFDSSSDYSNSGLYIDGDNTPISQSETIATVESSSNLKGSTAETTLSEFDFQNVWKSQDNDYPTLRAFIVSDSTININSPANNSEYDFNDNTDIEFNVQSGGEDVDVTLDVEKPDSTSENILTETLLQGSSKSYSEQFTFEDVGQYKFTIKAEGQETSVQKTLYLSSKEPDDTTFSLNTPVGETIKSYENTASTEFNFDVNSSQLNGNGFIQIKNESEPDSSYQNIGSFNYESNEAQTFSSNLEFNVPDSGTQVKEWRVKTVDAFENTTSNSATFTVERLQEPTVTIERPNDGEVFYVEEGNSRQIPFEGWINGSEETGEAFGEALRGGIGGSVPRDSLGLVSEGDNYVQGDVLTDANTYSDAKIEFVTDSGATFSSNELSFDILNANPVITEFNVSSDEVQNLENIEPGDFFDITLEGEIKKNDIDYIEYRLEDSSGTVLESQQVQSSNIYQDENIFTNSLDNAFEMKESYAGKTLELEANAVDTEGIESALETQVVQTGTPPNDFLLNSPNVGEFFLIPEGQNEVSVDIDYGVDSSELDGDLKLFVNGNNVETQSVGSNTQQTFTYTDTYTEGTQNWYLEWTDSTGETYTSETSNFEVSQYPVGLSLDSPQSGSTVELVDETGSINHNFTVSSEAFTGDWYYEFELTNGNGTVVGSETSTTYSGVEQQFTETVNGIEEGSYTYNVGVYDASDDSEIISKSKSYDTEYNPTQDVEILSPNNGSVYMIEENQNDRTVEIEYRVDAKETNVDTELTVNGETVDTQTVTSGTTETFTAQTQALTQGTYTASLSTTDGQGREVTSESSFDVVPYSEEDTVPEIESITFEPQLTKAEAGDEIDVFITGSGVPDDVDNVELQVQFGEQTEIITIQQDELTEGSWNVAKRAAFTVAADYVGLDTYVKGIVTDVTGRINTFFKSLGTTSGETTISARLDTPVDGDKITQVEGSDSTVAFTGIARADANEANWSLVVEGQSLASGTIPADGEVNVEEYFAPSTWSSSQFGEYDARIRVEDTVTGDVQTSTTNTFEVVNQTGEPVLSFEQPRDDKIFRINPAEQKRDVNLLFETELQQGQTGTYTVNIKDRERNTTTEYTDFDTEVTQAEVDEGFAERRITIPFNRGVYGIEVLFETDDGQYSLEESKSIEVTEREEVAEGNVKLGTPVDGTDVLQSRGFYFITEAQTNDDAGDDAYVVTTIEDNGGNVVEQFNNTIKPGSANSLQNLFPSGNDLGEYSWSAELYDSNGSLLDSSETNGFTVADLTTPTNTFDMPEDGQVYQTDEAVEFEYTVRAYERTLDSEARIRRAGKFDTLVQSGTEVKVFAGDSTTVTASRADLSPGKYEWFVRNSFNPEWDSEVRTFTVEKADLQEPTIELVRPEQGVTFEYDTGENYSTVSFDSMVEVFSEADSNVELLVEEVSEDSEYQSFDYGTLTNNDGETNLTKDLQLNESGYRWKVNVTQAGESYVSNSRSFVVDDPETEAVPELPTQEDEENIIDRATDAFSNFLGERGQFMFSILFILASSSFLTVVTRSEKIGLSAMILLALGFSITGWIPSWIAAVFTFLSVGVAIFITSRVMGGMR